MWAAPGAASHSSVPLGLLRVVGRSPRACAHCIVTKRPGYRLVSKTQSGFDVVFIPRVCEM